MGRNARSSTADAEWMYLSTRALDRLRYQLRYRYRSKYCQQESPLQDEIEFKQVLYRIRILIAI